MRMLHKGEKGFTLVEVLITIGLLGFIALAFFSFMSAAASSLIHADERTIAESLARSQMEFIKNTGYNPEGTYSRIPTDSVPGYIILSVDSEGKYTAAADPLVGIPWDSTGNKPALGSDPGLQMVALVIMHQQVGGDKVIYTFTNHNDNWADGVEMTLQGYVRDPDAWAQT